MLYVLTALAGLVPLASTMIPTLGSHLLPCPAVHPQPDVNIDHLLGLWHLTLLVVDATEEDFVESGICVSGDLQRHNKSVVRQVWTMNTVEVVGGKESETVAMIDLPTTVVRPGVWSVHTPLGGELKAVVFESSPKSHMLVTHCGFHHGSLVHLWTAAITRSRILSPKLRRYLISSLEDHGFHPLHTKVVSWHGC